MSLNVKLVVVGGDVKTTELTLRLPSTIGRGRGTSIILPHPLVSRQHCELYEADGQLMVRDLGSLNGTFVNNQRITESFLAPGELLTVGTVTFRAVYEIDNTLSSSQGATPKGPGSERTRPPTKTTSKAPAKTATKPAAAADDSGPLDFDFGKPLTSDEPAAASAPGGPAHATQSLDSDLFEDLSSKSGAKKGAKPASGKPPAPEKAPAKKTPAPQDADDEPKKPSSSSDEDLNDFLESLNE